MSNEDTAIVEAELMWPFLGRRNDMSNKYQVDLANLDKAAIKTLEGIGVTIRKDEPKEGKPDRGMFITAKSEYPIKVVFANGVEVVESTVVGNHTKAKVKVNAYDWKFKGNSGRSLGATKLQVTELVKYELTDDDFEDSTPAPDTGKHDVEDEFED